MGSGNIISSIHFTSADDARTWAKAAENIFEDKCSRKPKAAEKESYQKKLEKHFEGKSDPIVADARFWPGWRFGVTLENVPKPNCGTVAKPQPTALAPDKGGQPIAEAAPETQPEVTPPQPDATAPPSQSDIVEPQKDTIQPSEVVPETSPEEDMTGTIENEAVAPVQESPQVSQKEINAAIKEAGNQIKELKKIGKKTLANEVGTARDNLIKSHGAENTVKAEKYEALKELIEKGEKARIIHKADLAITRAKNAVKALKGFNKKALANEIAKIKNARNNLSYALKKFKEGTEKKENVENWIKKVNAAIKQGKARKEELKKEVL